MKTIYRNTTIKRNDSVQGETIEGKFERILNNKEPITDGAPLIYTERSEGISPGYDIRTDRFEVALDGIEKIQKSQQARREEKAKMEVVKDDQITEGESAQGNSN